MSIIRVQHDKDRPDIITIEQKLSFLENFVSGEKFRTYNVEIARKLGDVSYAVLLNDLLDQHKYLLKKNMLISNPKFGDDLMYYTSSQAWDRCAIKKDYFDAGIRKFESLGFLKKCRFGIPCKSYYQIDRVAIANWLFSNNFYSCGNSHNLKEESPQQDVGIPTCNDTNVIPKYEPNLKKDNVLRDSGNVHNTTPTYTLSSERTLETMPSFIDKSKTLEPSRRWKLNEDQQEAFNFLDGDHIDTDQGTKAYWAKKYSLSRLIEVYEETKAAKGVRSVAAYMQKLLKTGANVPKGHAASNRDFSVYFQEKTGWHQMEIMKKYIKIPCGKGMEELSFNMEPSLFQEVLERKYINRN